MSKDNFAFVSTNVIQCHISFLIASKRPYEDYAKKTVDSIIECVTFGSKRKISYEIIVCHPEPILDSRVKWIKDPICRGGNSAFNLAYAVSSGQYACVLVDDAILIGDIGGVVDIFESELFADRTFKILSLAGGMSNMATTLASTPDYKEYLDHIGVDMKDFTPLVAPFPIISRKTIDTLMAGYIFRPDIEIMGDIFLGAYLHLAQEPLIQYNMAKLFVHENNLKEREPDPITNINRTKFFIESYVNTYKIINEYLRVFDSNRDKGKLAVMSYLWTPDGFKYEKPQDVINFYKNKKII